MVVSKKISPSARTLHGRLPLTKRRPAFHRLTPPANFRQNRISDGREIARPRAPTRHRGPGGGQGGSLFSVWPGKPSPGYPAQQQRHAPPTSVAIVLAGLVWPQPKRKNNTLIALAKPTVEAWDVWPSAPWKFGAGRQNRRRVLFCGGSEPAETAIGVGYGDGISQNNKKTISRMNLP